VLQRVTKNTAAILSVDFAGNPVDYRTLRAVARSRNIPLISDAAHSFAATVGNRSVATLADFIVFSFYATKNLTCAEGGMVVSRNKTNAQKIRRMSRHGMTTNAHDRKRQRGWNYDIPYLGLKANLSDVHAAIGLGMLRRFDTDQQKRRACAKRYSHNLSTLSEYLTLPQERPNTIHGWHLFVIQLNLDTLRITRDACIDHMRKRGVECGLHYRPITELSWYKKHVPFNQKQLSVLRRVAPTMMSLPLHPGLSAGDVDHVCKSLTDVVKRYRR
jgi:dTDP-4-amino-4,6-dideoxygalactose transaminase